jgi:hypothetical protein
VQADVNIRDIAQINEKNIKNRLRRMLPIITDNAVSKISKNVEMNRNAATCKLHLQKRLYKEFEIFCFIRKNLHN